MKNLLLATALVFAFAALAVAEQFHNPKSRYRGSRDITWAKGRRPRHFA